VVAPFAGSNSALVLRAAHYVRMSTDRQEYSTQNQLATIATYATERNLQIVREYADEARSGLRIEGRDGLKRLIQDVQSGEADFCHVLVYDVSRWGRFQDTDESAHYEFICKQAGILVHYCAEQFENDGSLFSTMFKNIKRAMAGELSRDLSEKVFAGQSRLFKLGFRQGGQPGYGFQRILTGPDRSPKTILHFGDRKSIQSDRVILQPGLPHEIRTVRRIFRMFTREGKSTQEITDLLNQERILNQLGRPWARSTIRRMITNEKYIGNMLYNQTSSKLRKKNAKNPASAWLRLENAFDRIIEPATFKEAQRIIADRRDQRASKQSWENAEIINLLARLLSEKGQLTSELINDADGLPHSTLYRQRFGSLRQAYQLAGYKQEANFKYFDGQRSVTATIASLATELTTQINCNRASAAFNASTSTLTINNAATVALYVARSVRLPTGSLRWKIGRKIDRGSKLVVLVRMKEANEGILDYYVLPQSEIPERRIEFQDWPRFDPFRVTAQEGLAPAILWSLGVEPSG
jgi:DNA invertase Pin-like site-specific DNA recombinase